MSFLRDIAYAFRQIRRKPALPIAVVISLGLAMGVNTSLFSVVNTVWFAPWNVPDADDVRIVDRAVPASEARAWAEGTRAFSSIASVQADMGVYRRGHAVEYVEAVSPNYFDVLEVPVAAGHTFVKGEAGLIISDEVWRREFGKSPDILGKTIRLDTVDARRTPSLSAPIIGIAAPGFQGAGLGFPRGFWMQLDEAGRTPVRVFGRLAPGASNAQAEVELTSRSRAFHANQPPPEPIELRTTDQYSQSRGLSPQVLAMWESLLAGIVFITFIACGNVSNLLLALGLSRRAEVALRLAIGASRGRVVRQLLTETFVLSSAAGGVALAIAGWLPNEIIRRALPATAPEDLIHIPVDHRVFLWSLTISLVACFAFGLVPALRSTEGSLNEALKNGQANGRKALMPGLLSYQTIVSVIALAVAGMMFRSGSASGADAVGVSATSLTARIVAGFGGVALLLGTIGYFSVLQYSVAERRREIGIRRALGAQAADIVRAVALSAAFPIVRGFATGAVGAAVIGLVMRRAELPSGVNPFDVPTYAGVAIALACSAALAAVLPTRRALRVQPQEALRSE